MVGASGDQGALQKTFTLHNYFVGNMAGNGVTVFHTVPVNWDINEKVFLMYHHDGPRW